MFEFREGGCERSPGRLPPAIMSHSQNLAFVSGLIGEEEKVPSVISPITRAPAHAPGAARTACKPAARIMPAAYAFDLLGRDDGWRTLASGLAALSLVWAIRTWSKGYVLREHKELAGKTFLLTVRLRRPALPALAGSIFLDPRGSHKTCLLSMSRRLPNMLRTPTMLCYRAASRASDSPCCSTSPPKAPK